MQVNIHVDVQMERNPGPATISFSATDWGGDIIASQDGVALPNNPTACTAEYKSILAALEHVVHLPRVIEQEVCVWSRNRLVVDQLNGKAMVLPRLNELFLHTKHMETFFVPHGVKYVYCAR